MSDQKQTRRAPETDARTKDGQPSKSADPKSETSVSDGLDDLLDEIDEVLETNAEEFVKSYVQKGGE